MHRAVNNKQHVWQPQREAAERYRAWIRGAATINPALRRLTRVVAFRACIRLHDIVDHVEVHRPNDLQMFSDNGWCPTGPETWKNSNALLPPLRRSQRTCVWIRVESLDRAVVAMADAFDFDSIEGEPDAPIRKVEIRAPSGSSVGVGLLERNGGAGFEVVPTAPSDLRNARRGYQTFASRRREFDDPEVGLLATDSLVSSVVDDIGPHRACAIWLRSEREFWMTRCRAGRQQKERQDLAGVGWANIDHYTYDGSRRHFASTIGILKRLGFELREMLYAGELAGWGSQVLEQPVIGSTVFADVDLAPEELDIDFAHEALPPLERHRRAGLLSALLGESILEAGLNHVAGLYDQRRLRALLQRQGTAMMAPFSTMRHLYQELTVGDWGSVDPRRVEALANAGHIDQFEAEQLMTRGAIVTHLENIERNDGYKGFNREGIDAVLRKLDPRAYRAAD